MDFCFDKLEFCSSYQEGFFFIIITKNHISPVSFEDAFSLYEKFLYTMYIVSIAKRPPPQYNLTTHSEFANGDSEVASL